MDRIIEELNGEVVNDLPFGGIILGKELQKNVIEFVPGLPQTSLVNLERVMYGGMQRFRRATGYRHTLLGLGMHPLLTLDQTSYWDHQDKDIYDEYDRLFGLRQHGWLNIQALQVNVRYGTEEEMVRNFNRLRSLLPCLAAVTASSPFVEGRATGIMDNRLLHYRKNQERVPLICNNIVPEKLRSREHHDLIIGSIYAELRKIGGEALCEEWIDSRGVIIRYRRQCLELKVPDEQECLRSDVAVAAFVLALLRADLRLEEDHETLLEMNEKAIARGTAAFRPELRRLYDAAFRAATAEERAYLPLVRGRIEDGSLAEIMGRRVRDGESVREVAKDMASRLCDNRPC